MEQDMPPPLVDGESTHPAPDEAEAFDAHLTRWPKVIGVISIVYALLGLAGQALQVTFTLLGEWLAGLGGMDVTMPAVIKLTSFVSGVLLCILAVMLLVGGVRLLRRSSSGVRLIKRWAVLRLLLLLVGTGAGVVLLPAQVEFQRRMVEATNDRLREAGQEKQMRDFDESAVWKQTLIQMAVGAGIVSIYPVFVGFYLSRRRIDTEIDQWT